MSRVAKSDGKVSFLTSAIPEDPSASRTRTFCPRIAQEEFVFSREEGRYKPRQA